MSEDRDQPPPSAEKSACVVPVHDHAARKDVAQLIRRQGDGQMLPVNQVAAERVPPVEGSFVLIKEVILTLVEDQPVRVVHPALRWREMILWPKKIVR